MGASNVAAVFANWPHLSDRPKLLLIRMALVSKDDDRPPRYFGGSEDICHALGLDPTNKNHRTMASRAASQLEKAGAIRRVEGTGYRGRRQEYELTLVRVTPQSPSAPVDETAAPRGKGDSTVAERVTPQSPKGGSTVTPRKTRNHRGAKGRKDKHLPR